MAQLGGQKPGQIRRTTRAQIQPMSASSITVLPHAIILNILLRQHAKTIVRCKCVCKTWLRILSHPHFAKIHLRIARPVLMIHSRKTLNVGGPNTGVSWVPEGGGEDTKFTLSFANTPLVSCNGFVLCADPVRFTISNPIIRETDQRNILFSVCNPITRESCGVPRSANNACLVRVLGFGFSPGTNQYKVVQLLSNAHVEVHTLGTSSWRYTCPSPYYSLDKFETPYFGAYLNGVLHWWIWQPELDLISVSCFHLDREQFGSFPGPPIQKVGHFNRQVMSFGVLGCCLYFCRYVNCFIDLWVMKNYKVNKLWTNYVYANIPMAPFCMEIKVGKHWDDGKGGGGVEIVYLCGAIYSYSTRTNCLTNFSARNYCEFISARNYCWFISYTPSFVLLKDILMNRKIR